MMNPDYTHWLQYLYDLQFSGIKLGLQNITRLLESLGNPHRRFPAIHLAGTNGKGSTAAFMASILREAGYRVGLYTSPHLVDFTERIRVNGVPMPQELLVEYVQELHPLIEQIHPTFFEATTAIAFRYFAEKQVDVAVVETGLGGRLDATNVLEPLVAVITPIGLEHQQYLGETLEEIAREKAGIIKAGVPVVTSHQHPAVSQVLRSRARELGSPFVQMQPGKEVEIQELTIEGGRFTLHAGERDFPDLRIPLAGRHQVYNAALAVEALLQIKEVSLPEPAIRKGLEGCEWPARLQIIRRQPLVLLDVSHNPPGFQSTFRFLRELFPTAAFKLILGLAKDKDYPAIVDIVVRQVQEVVLVEWFSDRGLPAAALQKAFEERQKQVRTFPDVISAFHQLQKEQKADEVLIIMGSHYLAGRFLETYREEK